MLFWKFISWPQFICICLYYTKLLRKFYVSLLIIFWMQQASQGRISKELLNRLMSILGHLIQLRTLKVSPSVYCYFIIIVCQVKTRTRGDMNLHPHPPLHNYVEWKCHLAQRPLAGSSSSMKTMWLSGTCFSIFQLLPQFSFNLLRAGVDEYCAY